ncbi:MAG: hypothetical protein L0Z62_29190, partial [Gemmataceae bacterium]|nr:hypothetical protein [Gemmataceae bacterium]
MTETTGAPPTVRETAPAGLKDLTLAVQRTEGFHPLVAALQNGRAATIDGAWNSSAALAASALGLHTSGTLVIVLAHPRDSDPWCEDILSFAGLRPVVFPAWDAWPVGERVVDEVAGQRLRLLKQLQSGEPPRYLVTTMQAALQPVPDRAELERRRRRVRVGERLDLEDFTRWLVEQGFQRMEAVELPGEFSRRGGILDVFSPDSDHPHRIELFGDEVESIRQFAPDTQRSLGEAPSVEITAASGVRARSVSEGQDSPSLTLRALSGHSPLATLADYLPPGSWVVLVEPEELYEQGKLFLERTADVRGLFSVEGALQQLLRFASVHVSALPSPTVEATCHLRVESVERFSGDVTRVRDELDSASAGDVVMIACHNDAERKRLGEVLAAGQLAQSDRLRLVVGRVRAGFRLLLPDLASRGREPPDTHY